MPSGPNPISNHFRAAHILRQTWSLRFVAIVLLFALGCARQERRELEQSFHVMRAVQHADAAERDARSSAQNVEDIRSKLSAADLALTDARIARLSAERARAEAFSRMRSRK
ncbi:MAG: hypothetical protein IT290_00485 [Deltaproteobacteria bacterium]|nr:hypothetical protein [Deltaproteobacteria bacterium]